MPVVPENIPKFTIREPMTAGDKGIPTSSLAKDADRVFAFIEDERHLIAHELYTSVKRRLAEYQERQKQEKTKQPRSKVGGLLFRQANAEMKQKELQRLRLEEDVSKARRKLEAKKDVLEKLENRCRIFRRAQRNLNSDEDWTFASLHFGITTYYRREADESLSIKLEGEISGVPLFEQVAVLRDVDHHYKWVPFCTSSMTIAELDKLDLVGWFMTGVPQIGLARDGCFRVIGCDNMSEDGSILIAGQGINDLRPDAPEPEDTYLSKDPLLGKLPIPPVPNRRGNGRMTIRKFETVVHVISPTSATTRMVANVDPNIPFLSQKLIDFLLKHLAGVMLHKLQSAAKKVVKNPSTNHHAQKMRDESDFYELWLMSKFRSLCDERGWEMPTVKAFVLNEEYLSHNRYQQHHRRNRQTATRLNTFEGTAHESSVGTTSDEDGAASCKSTPNFPTDLDDVVSEITTRSNFSLWQNPVAQYLRQVEEKDRQKKQAEIAQVRDRVANLIKPKQLPFEKQERLRELKHVKGRRLTDRGGGDDASSNASEYNNDSGSSVANERDTLSRRHEHGRLMRFGVTFTLVAVLFILLHPRLLLRETIEWLDTSQAWWIQPFQDIGTVLYLLLCSACHFLLCDSALVYAFGALDLGSKTGRQVKSYYSQNVRMGVALASFGIVGVSLLKAFVKVSARQSIYHASHFLVGVGQAEADEDGAIGTNESILTEALAPVLVLMKGVAYYARALATHISENYVVGRVVGEILSRIVQVPVDYASRLNSFVMDAVEAEASPGYRQWRSEAFLTAKSLLSYTAVFLLVTLVLFNLSAQSSRRERSPTKKTKTIVNVTRTAALKPSDTGTSPASSFASALTAPDRPQTPQNSRVPAATTATSPSTQHVDSSTSSRKRSLLRFRRKKSKTVSEHPLPSKKKTPGLHKSSSY